MSVLAKPVRAEPDMRKRIATLLLCAAAVFLALRGQVSGQAMSTETNSAPDHTSRKPYTATYRITVTSKQAGGGIVTRQSTETIALDSAGRWMDATASLPTAGDPAPLRHIRVDDPIARTTSIWDVPGKEVTVIAMAAPGMHLNCSPEPRDSDLAATTPRSMPTVQDLGTQTIHGIEAHGKRTLFAIAPALAANSEAQGPTLEVWFATDPNLSGLAVRVINVDPRGDTSSRELESVTVGEPDPSLFRPPAGVRIVNRPAAVPKCPGGAQASEWHAPISASPAQ